MGQWDEDRPGFVEIDLVGHDDGNASGEHAFTLTVTDIATGWTETRSARNKAQKWVFAALEEIIEILEREHVPTRHPDTAGRIPPVGR